MRSRITGIGGYLPEPLVTNENLCALFDVGVTPTIIERTTGVKTRCLLREPGVGASGLGLHAARRALSSAGRDAEEVDCIVFSTETPDRIYPGSGVRLQALLGLADTCVPAFDLRSQCAGFVHALLIADAFIRCERFRCVLIVCAELHSTALRFDERGRDCAILFGDGAGAAVVEPTQDDGAGILAVSAHSDGSHVETIRMDAPGSLLYPSTDEKWIQEGLSHPVLDGPATFKWARRRMSEAVHEVLAQADLEIDAIDRFLFHQANGRISGRLIRDMGLPEERCPSNIERVGNISSASIPLLLAEEVEAQRIGSGDLLALSAFGAGFTWGAAVVRW